jgi:hypothetical protein
VGVLLLLLAILFWIARLIFGPVHHAANELNRRSK